MNFTARAAAILSGASLSTVWKVGIAPCNYMLGKFGPRCIIIRITSRQSELLHYLSGYSLRRPLTASETATGTFTARKARFHAGKSSATTGRLGYRAAHLRLY